MRKRGMVRFPLRRTCFRWALSLFAFEQLALKGVAWVAPLSTAVYALYFLLDMLIPCLLAVCFMADARKRRSPCHVLVLLVCVLLGVSAWITRENALLYSGIMILLARNMDMDGMIDSLYRSFGLALCLLLSAFFLRLTVSLPVNFSYGMGYSFGMAHPNNFGAAATAFLLLWAYRRREKPFLQTVLIMEAVGLIVFRFTLSRTSWIILLLYPAVYLLLRLPYRVRGEWLIRLTYLEFFALMGASVALMLYSERSSVLPVFFGDQNYLARFTSALSLYNKHGVHLFGAYIEYRSLRLALLTGKEAVILDSAYLYLLIGQGISALLVFFILISRAVSRLIRKRQFALLAILGLFLASGMMERYMLYCYMNFPLLAVAAALGREKKTVLFPALQVRRGLPLGRRRKTKYNIHDRQWLQSAYAASNRQG